MTSEETSCVWPLIVRNFALGIALLRVSAVIRDTRSAGTERSAPIAEASYNNVGATALIIEHIGALRMASI